MIRLFYFEFKKIVSKRVNQTAMLLGLLLVIICDVSLIQQETLCDGTTELKGAEAVLRQSEIENSLTSELTEEFLTGFLREYQQALEGNPDRCDFSLIETKTNLFSCIAKNYSEWYDSFTWEMLSDISVENEIGFYDRRIKKIESLLNADYSFGNYTDAEKEYWMKKANTVQTPFQWGSSDTWFKIWDGIGLLLYLFFVISICIAPVFSGEYQNRTDALLLSSKYGRSRVISAKIAASFVFVFLYFAFCSFVSIGINCFFLGFDGWNLPVQLWDTIIPYPWTTAEAAAVHLLIMFLLSFLLTAISLLLSAVSRNPMIVLAIDIVLFWGTALLPASQSSSLWNKIRYLLPMHCVDIRSIMKTYNSYSFGQVIISYPEMIVIVNVLLTAVCLLLTRRIFKRRQIGK